MAFGFPLPAACCCTPAFRGAARLESPGVATVSWCWALGCIKVPSPRGCRSLKDSDTWHPQPQHEGCVVLGRCLWRWSRSKPGGAPGHPLEPVKTTTSAATSCRQSSENRAPKSVSTSSLGNGKFRSHQYLDPCFSSQVFSITENRSLFFKMIGSSVTTVSDCW